MHVSRWLGIGMATVVVAAIVTGCGPRIDRMRLAMKVTPEGPYGASLRKTVVILPIQNRTQVAEPTVSARFRQPVANRLQDRCPEIRFAGPSAESLPSALTAMNIGAAGNTNQDLLVTARKNGFTALVGVALADVQVHTEPKGIWVFTYDDFSMDITAEVVVFSPETGAKQLDTQVMVTVDISDLDFHAFRENPAHPVGAIDDALEELVDDLTDIACEALGTISWFAEVASVEDGSVTLIKGSADGLASGMDLHIFNGNTPIDGNDRTQYRVPGHYRGRVTIDSVDTGTATATIIDGIDTIAAGDIAIPPR